MSPQKKLISCCVCNDNQSDELYKDELGECLPPVGYDFSPETRKTYRIAKCRSCGHIFTNPMPFIADVYTENSNEVYHDSKHQRIKTFNKILKIVYQYKRSGKVLDIGCATGILLDVFSSSFETYGIEPSAWSRERCNPGHKVASTVDDFLGKRFDVITLLGVIEHLQYPDKLVSIVSRLMADDGYFLVYTGDVGAVLPRILGKKWWWYQGMHLHYFSKRTIGRLLENYGIEIIKSINMPLYFTMESLCISMKRYKQLYQFAVRFLCLPVIKDFTLPLPLDGEMLLICRRMRNENGASS